MLHKLKLPLLALAVAMAACDEPPPEIVPAAGSFALPGACGSIIAAPNGDIFTFSKTSNVGFKVDRRTLTGTLIWTATLLGATDCTGAVTVSGDLAASGGDSIFVLNGASGDVRWRKAAASPRVATSLDGRIYVATVPFGSIPATLSAYNSLTGVPVWTQNVTDRGAPYLNQGALALHYVRRAGARSVNALSGAVQWESPITNADRSQDAAIATDGTLVIGIDNDFYSAVAAFTPQGTQKWINNVTTPRNLVTPPVIDDSSTVYYAACGSLNTGCMLNALSVATGQLIWRKDFERIESDLVVDANRTVWVIARLTNAVPYQLYGLRNGATVSVDMAQGITTNSQHPLALHFNKLLYYIGTDIIYYRPTAGISTFAAWPVPKHDPVHTARYSPPFLPD